MMTKRTTLTVLSVAAILFVCSGNAYASGAKAFAHCKGSGKCSVKGKVLKPLHIYLQEVISGEAVTIKETCSKKGSAPVTYYGSFTYDSSKPHLLKKPFLHPDSCVIVASADPGGTTAIHFVLSATHW